MMPRIVGNPLIAWRNEATLQIGWGTHCVVVEQAPARLPEWLRLVNGSRDLDELTAQAVARDIDADQADELLQNLGEAGLLAQLPPVRVSLQPCGLLTEPFTRALRDAGVVVSAGADVLVYPQGQLPSLMGCPPLARRLVPVWFASHAVHVGPVIDRDSGPCPLCVDAAWTKADPAWPNLVSQAGTTATWTDPAQVTFAAAMVALIADAPSTVGLEMIVDPAHPGPRWRVWSVTPGCRCQALATLPQPALTV